MLVGLRFLRFWLSRLPTLCVVGHLDLQRCWQTPGLVRAARVLWLLRLQCRPDPLTPPLNQCYPVTDGFGHNLHITLVEKSRIDLRRQTRGQVCWGPAIQHHLHNQTRPSAQDHPYHSPQVSLVTSGSSTLFQVYRLSMWDGGSHPASIQ